MARRKQYTTGRHKGSRQRGWWFRAGRGWYTTDHGQKVPLTDVKGNHYKDRDTPTDLIEQAYARYRLGMQQKNDLIAAPDAIPLADVLLAYLTHAEQENRQSTFEKRGEFLFDFVYGLPCRFWDYGTKRKVPKPTKEDYIHNGFGKRHVGTLTPFEVQQWLDTHKGWGKGTRRMAVQALKRALNWAVKEARITKANPIRGYKVSMGRKRITVFTEKQEAHLYENCTKAMATVLRVCIRTGARYGSEAIKLTAAHVEETERGMLWRFSPDESKNHKPRVIYVPPEIAEIIRPLMKRYPTGYLLRNRYGNPWKIDALRRAFLRIKGRLAKKGVKLDPDACLYSSRHTFAKRTLGGYWTGQPTTIEVLAGLMGNSRQVAWEHYGKWCESYTEPLWAATLGGNGNKH